MYIAHVDVKTQNRIFLTRRSIREHKQLYNNRRWAHNTRVYDLHGVNMGATGYAPESVTTQTVLWNDRRRLNQINELRCAVCIDQKIRL